MAAFNNTTDGITDVAGSADVVALHADEHVVAGGVDLAGAIGAEDIGQAAAGRFGHAGLRPREPGDFGKRGREVDETDVVVGDAAATRNAGGPHGGERDVVGILIRAAFAAGKGHAVIGGDDDEGVGEQAAFFECGQHAAEVGVEVFDLVGVIEEVVAGGLVVGQEGRYAVDVGEFLAALGDAGAELVAAVRFDGAIPEGPRFVGRGGGEEVVEVAGVIRISDTGGGRLGFALVESFPGHGARLAGGVFRDTGAPALSGVADGPAVFGEGFAPAFELGWEITEVVGGFLELPRVAAGENGGARGGALGVGRVGVFKKNAVAGHAVEMGSAHPLRAVGTGVDAPVIGDGEEDVGRARRGGFGGVDRGGDDAEEEEQERKGAGETEGRVHEGGEWGEILARGASRAWAAVGRCGLRGRSRAQGEGAGDCGEQAAGEIVQTGREHRRGGGGARQSTGSAPNGTQVILAGRRKRSPWRTTR